MTGSQLPVVPGSQFACRSSTGMMTVTSPQTTSGQIHDGDDDQMKDETRTVTAVDDDDAIVWRKSGRGVTLLPDWDHSQHQQEKRFQQKT